MNAQVVKGLEAYLGSDEAETHGNEVLQGLTINLRENVERPLRHSQRIVAVSTPAPGKRNPTSTKQRRPAPAQKSRPSRSNRRRVGCDLSASVSLGWQRLDEVVRRVLSERSHADPGFVRDARVEPVDTGFNLRPSLPKLLRKPSSASGKNAAPLWTTFARVFHRLLPLPQLPRVPILRLSSSSAAR